MAPPVNSGWPARFVIGVQLGVWCVVGALLLHMGMSSFTPEATPPLNTTMVNPTPSLNDTADNYSDTSANSTQTLPQGNSTTHPSKKPIYKPSSVLMITVGATMLILGPIVLIIREIDTRRQYHSFVKVDPPPNYDDVTEPAPRYSTLFEVGEGGECIAINCPTADVYGGEGRKPLPCDAAM